jgi:hypothetical protein
VAYSYDLNVWTIMEGVTPAKAHPNQLLWNVTRFHPFYALLEVGGEGMGPQGAAIGTARHAQLPGQTRAARMPAAGCARRQPTSTPPHPTPPHPTPSPPRCSWASPRRAS